MFVLLYKRGNVEENAPFRPKGNPLYTVIYLRPFSQRNAPDHKSDDPFSDLALRSMV